MAIEPAAADIARIRDALDDQGYFELAPCVPPALVASARDDVDRVCARGAPAVTAFLFDPMWQILDEVLPIARAALDGAEVALLPRCWAWRIEPGELGWGPHRDHPAHVYTADGALASITLWIPLVDATPRNGCMHVVPKYWDYEYYNPTSRGEVTQQQYLRALPAAAGSVLGWSAALLHWGGACAPDAPPRIATSFELLRVGEAPPADERTYPAGWRPTLDERVAMLDEAIAKYWHMQEIDDAQRAAIAAVVADARAAAPAMR
jgi:Phytanoyl-CoA dioxygenase (PhyH)